MGAYEAMFGGETVTSSKDENLIAPKKSTMFGQNPQIQNVKTDEDELDAIMRGSVERNKKKKEPSFLESAAGNVVSAVDMLAGVPNFVGYGVGRAFGLNPQEAQAAASKVPEAVAQPLGRLTGMAQTEAYQKSVPSAIQNYIGEHLNEGAESISKRFNIPLQDAQALIEAGLTAAGGYGAAKVAPKALPAMQQAFEKAKGAVPKVRVEPQKTAMQSGGAAAATNKAILDEAISRASPELAAELKTVNPANIDPVALERYLDADSLGVRLTKGQASQDPTLISNERNARGQDPQLVERFNEQNKALLEKAAEVKEKAAPDVYAPDYVANAEGALEYIANKVKQNETATGDAYRALDEFGAGKIEVDSKTFADNAMKALSAKEDIDFLPTTIANKIKSYQDGKSMNFDQYENLRTQIARETRKAQQAGDGNSAHALSLVRGELEKLPLIGETAEAKPLADKARATAKAEFDLVNRSNPAYNKVYADYVNGVTDTKDFIQSAVLRSKNKDFAKTMELFDDPVAKQNLRAGALDLIIKDATDTSGNFKPAKFAKAIENLDVNKKLDALFGEEAQTLRKIARTGQLVEARPAGAFVNESNTAVTQMATEYAKRLASKTPLVGGLVEPAINIMAERSAKKATQESLRPGAAVKLKNIGKE